MSSLPTLGRATARHVQLLSGLGGTLITRQLQGKSTVGGYYQTKSQEDWDRLHHKDTEDFKQLLHNNNRWRHEMVQEDPEYFKRMAHSQSPQYLWIGCSDSRVPAETLVGLDPGELFVHRNVANLVVNSDMNCLSVLTYAVEVLKVKHIIVAGHYNCGGVRAATQTGLDLGILEHWLRNIRDIQRLHQTELMNIADPEKRYRRLIELNVAEQCINLFKTGVVQQSRKETAYPLIHGVVYDIADGKLQRLDLDLIGYLRKYKSEYQLFQ